MVFIALTATGATAWLTLRLTSQQFTEAAATDQQTAEDIVAQIASYGKSHGTWTGVPLEVERLSAQTGKRIKLEAESGEVIVDSDTLDGRTARPTAGAPLLANPRPALLFSTEELRGDVYGQTAAAIANYRHQILLSSCLTEKNAPAEYFTLDPGVTRAGGLSDLALEMRLKGDHPMVKECLLQALPTKEEITTTLDLVRECIDDSARITCLRAVFAQRTDDIAPLPLLVHIGAVGDNNETVVIWPIAAAAGGIMLLVILGTAVLSRRVLRPVELLTKASQGLGTGDLSRRVQVSGNDEFSMLASTFNHMAQSLQEGEDRQRRLVADVAHEIRTPLANLRGYLEALKDNVLPPSPALFASLHEETMLQQRIVDDLQDLALAESGQLAYHKSHIDLGDLLQSCRVAVEVAAETAGVQVFLYTPEPVTVYADPDRLRQVVGNLLNNALRYTDAGGTVTLSSAQTGDVATIKVTDTGTGIHPEHVPRLFDRFWRADAARTRSSGHSGLGLAIAQQITHDHNGTITVASELGAGTTFTISMPAASSLQRAGVVTPVSSLPSAVR